jgi:hypothetical protein
MKKECEFDTLTVLPNLSRILFPLNLKTAVARSGLRDALNTALTCERLFVSSKVDTCCAEERLAAGEASVTFR